MAWPTLEFDFYLTNEKAGWEVGTTVVSVDEKRHRGFRNQVMAQKHGGFQFAATKAVTGFAIVSATCFRCQLLGRPLTEVNGSPGSPVWSFGDVLTDHRTKWGERVAGPDLYDPHLPLLRRLFVGIRVGEKTQLKQMWIRPDSRLQTANFKFFDTRHVTTLQQVDKMIKNLDRRWPAGDLDDPTDGTEGGLAFPLEVIDSMCGLAPQALTEEERYFQDRMEANPGALAGFLKSRAYLAELGSEYDRAVRYGLRAACLFPSDELEQKLGSLMIALRSVVCVDADGTRARSIFAQVMAVVNAMERSGSPEGKSCRARVMAQMGAAAFDWGSPVASMLLERAGAMLPLRSSESRSDRTERLVCNRRRAHLAGLESPADGLLRLREGIEEARRFMESRTIAGSRLGRICLHLQARQWKSAYSEYEQHTQELRTGSKAVEILAEAAVAFAYLRAGHLPEARAHGEIALRERWRTGYRMPTIGYVNEPAAWKPHELFDPTSKVIQRYGPTVHRGPYPFSTADLKSLIG